MIDAAAVPVIEGDMEALTLHATSLRSVGADLVDTGERVNSTWQELRTVYRAPEGEQLFAATLPVQQATASTGEDIGIVGTILIRYADEVRDIQTRLKALSGQAAEFQADMNVVEDPGADQVFVDRNNELLAAVNAAMADFDDAQRRCANSINALYRSVPTYRAPDDNGRVDPGEYGATAAQLDSLAAVGLPWGRSEAPSPPSEPVSVSDRVHGVFDVLGLVPGFGEAVDAVNAAWYATDGDWAGAGLSAAAMVPGFGAGATAGRILRRGARATAEVTEHIPKRTFVTTPRGTTFDIPPGWVSRPADNGKGIVFQRPGALKDADSIRIMEPIPQYPHGYYRYYNSDNQALDINGKPGGKPATHISEDYVGPTLGWPE